MPVWKYIVGGQVVDIPADEQSALENAFSIAAGGELRLTWTHGVASGWSRLTLDFGAMLQANRTTGATRQMVRSVVPTSDDATPHAEGSAALTTLALASSGGAMGATPHSGTTAAALSAAAAAASSTSLDGETVVFTGTLSVTRAEATAWATAAGAKVASSITGKTTLVVAGADAPGAKVEAAKARGVKVWTEAQLRSSLGHATPATATSAALTTDDADDDGDDGEGDARRRAALVKESKRKLLAWLQANPRGYGRYRSSGKPRSAAFSKEEHFDTSDLAQWGDDTKVAKKEGEGGDEQEQDDDEAHDDCYDFCRIVLSDFYREDPDAREQLFNSKEAKKFKPPLQHGDLIDTHGYRGVGLYILYGPPDALWMIKTGSEYGYCIPAEFCDAPEGYYGDDGVLTEFALPSPVLLSGVPFLSVTVRNALRAVVRAIREADKEAAADSSDAAAATASEKEEEDQEEWEPENAFDSINFESPPTSAELATDGTDVIFVMVPEAGEAMAIRPSSAAKRYAAEVFEPLAPLSTLGFRVPAATTAGPAALPQKATSKRGRDAAENEGTTVDVVAPPSTFTAAATVVPGAPHVHFGSGTAPQFGGGLGAWQQQLATPPEPCDAIVVPFLGKVFCVGGHVMEDCPVFGTGPAYARHSHLCAAAVHAGALPHGAAFGPKVAFSASATAVSPNRTYVITTPTSIVAKFVPACARNGVQSQSWSQTPMTMVLNADGSSALLPDASSKTPAPLPPKTRHCTAGVGPGGLFYCPGASCPAWNSYGMGVWGSNPYSEQSQPLCLAARHCGAIGDDGGSFVVKKSGKALRFTGCVAHGVSTGGNEQGDKSVTIFAADGSPLPPVDPLPKSPDRPEAVYCGDVTRRLDAVGKEVLVYCPGEARCAWRAGEPALKGANPYSMNSPPCLAAYHCGALPSLRSGGHYYVTCVERDVSHCFAPATWRGVESTAMRAAQPCAVTSSSVDFGGGFGGVVGPVVEGRGFIVRAVEVATALAVRREPPLPDRAGFRPCYEFASRDTAAMWPPGTTFHLFCSGDSRRCRNRIPLVGSNPYQLSNSPAIACVAARHCGAIPSTGGYFTISTESTPLFVGSTNQGGYSSTWMRPLPGWFAVVVPSSVAPLPEGLPTSPLRLLGGEVPPETMLCNWHNLNQHILAAHPRGLPILCVCGEATAGTNNSPSSGFGWSGGASNDVFGVGPSFAPSSRACRCAVFSDVIPDPTAAASRSSFLFYALCRDRHARRDGAFEGGVTRHGITTKPAPASTTELIVRCGPF